MSSDRKGQPVPGRCRGGRPTILTPEVEQRIPLALRAGATAIDAARSAGVSESTFFSWMADQRPRFRKLRAACEKAIAEHRVMLAGSITQAARQSPGVALKMLERRDPKNWGRARADLTDVPPELGPGPDQPAPTTGGLNVVVPPPEWSPFVGSMLRAVKSGQSPEEFVSELGRQEESATTARLRSLCDEGYGFGRDIPVPEACDDET